MKKIFFVLTFVLSQTFVSFAQDFGEDLGNTSGTPEEIYLNEDYTFVIEKKTLERESDITPERNALGSAMFVDLRWRPARFEFSGYNVSFGPTIKADISSAKENSFKYLESRESWIIGVNARLYNMQKGWVIEGTFGLGELSDELTRETGYVDKTVTKTWYAGLDLFFCDRRNKEKYFFAATEINISSFFSREKEKIEPIGWKPYQPIFFQNNLSTVNVVVQQAILDLHISDMLLAASVRGKVGHYKNYDGTGVYYNGWGVAADMYWGKNSVAKVYYDWNYDMKNSFSKRYEFGLQFDFLNVFNQWTEIMP